jgi:hypothetical protein
VSVMVWAKGDQLVEPSRGLSHALSQFGPFLIWLVPCDSTSRCPLRASNSSNLLAYGRKLLMTTCQRRRTRIRPAHPMSSARPTRYRPLLSQWRRDDMYLRTLALLTELQRFDPTSHDFDTGRSLSCDRCSVSGASQSTKGSKHLNS